MSLLQFPSFHAVCFVLGQSITPDFVVGSAGVYSYFGLVNHECRLLFVERKNIVGYTYRCSSWFLYIFLCPDLFHRLDAGLGWRDEVIQVRQGLQGTVLVGSLKKQTRETYESTRERHDSPSLTGVWANASLCQQCTRWKWYRVT